MASEQRYSVEQVIAAIRQGHVITTAAKILGCEPQTVRNYARRYKTVADAILEERTQLVDLAELSLRDQILKGENWAVTLALKTLGKDRGYVERQEHTGVNGEPIGFTVIVEGKKDD